MSREGGKRGGKPSRKDKDRRGKKAKHVATSSSASYGKPAVEEVAEKKKVLAANKRWFYVGKAGLKIDAHGLVGRTTVAVKNAQLRKAAKRARLELRDNLGQKFEVQAPVYGHRR